MTTIQRGGIPALYQGLTSPLIGAMVENATLFAAYGKIKTFLQVNPNPTLTNPVPMWKYLLAGAGSGVCSAFILTPVELVKCRLQIQREGVQRLYTGPVDVVRKILNKEGIEGLWRGNVSCLIREVPGNAAWFSFYETVRTQFQKYLNIERRKDLPLIWNALAGSCAGIAYWLVPFPADTVKSRLQTDPRYEGLSFIRAFRMVVQREGFLGLYNGLTVTCLRSAPSHALIFYFYELTSSILEKF